MICSRNGYQTAYFRRTSMKLPTIISMYDQNIAPTDAEMKNEITFETEWVKYEDTKIEYV